MDRNDIDDFAANYKPSEDNDRVVPYFEPFEVDTLARSRMLTPIEFDWSRICELDPIEEDKEWYDTPFYKHMCAKGLKHRRFLVSCATHGYFKQTIMDPPAKKIGYKCQKCITAEIDRIVGLRAKRDEELRKQAREAQK